jgi:tRNA (mo5U34)-methyltransferase
MVSSRCGTKIGRAGAMVERSAEEARQFLRESTCFWHQRFRLGGDVYTPGQNNMESLMRDARFPDDLMGKSVLDIGTANGAVAFEAERRGARRVVATDLGSQAVFGLDELRDFLQSQVEFREVSVYELASAFDEQFDVVVFWGVLYHLRHPLLGLDNVRALTRELLLLETAVADHELDPGFRELPLARFYRGAELSGDPSNWFTPTIATVLEWCSSAGLEPELVGAWPSDSPMRCAVAARPTTGEPEYVRVSYERPLACRVVAGPAAQT